MHIKSCMVRGRQFIAASFSEGRVVVVDYASREVIHDFPIPANCDDRFDLSPDGRCLAVAYGYSHRPWLDAWDLVTNERIYRTREPEAYDVAFDKTGGYIIFASTRGCYVWTLVNGLTQQLCGCERPSDGGFIHSENRFLIPTNETGSILSVQFDPVLVTKVRIPNKRVIWCLRSSPVDDVVIAIDSTACGVACYHERTYDSIWSTRLDGYEFDTATFSGNGKLVGIATGERGCWTTLVLDPISGEQIKTIDGHRCGEYPFGNWSVISTDGEILNLATGDLDSSLAHVSWWRRLGL